MTMRRATALIGLVLMLGACAQPGGSVVGSASATPEGSGDGVRTVDLARVTNGTPARREAATILIGFDAASVASMVAPAPTVDYATQAVLCLHIGERSTGGWSVTIQSISLDGSAMSIKAREVKPRPGVAVTQAFTYPADCAVIDRTALPSGTLTVRADDTTSDEFIVDATVEVPTP